jgi:monoamine oxidase
MKKSVLVIGAGISGVICARALHDHGYEVSVLEARNRIGGRIWTHQGVEMGAQWIHGTEGNPISNLVRQYGLETLFVGGDSVYASGWDRIEMIYDEAKKMSAEEKWQCILLWDEIYECYETLRRKNMENNAPDSSLRALLSLALQQFPHLTPLQRRWIEWHANACGRDDCSSSLDKLSGFYWDDGYEVYGYGDSVLLGGYSQLLDKLAEGLKIHLDAVVTEINYNGSMNSCVEVKTEKESFSADAVVVTVPLGVLKSEKIRFTPELPPNKLKAIQRLGTGCLAKVFLFFKEPFWSIDQDVFGYLPDNLSMQPTQIVNLLKISHQPTLLFLIGGDDGRTIETLSPEEAGKWAMNILKNIFGQNIPNPVKVIRSDWSTDPFALEAYSFLQTGSTPADIEALAEPIDSKVFFAGEATCRQHWACVHSAYVSGVTAAAAIMNKPEILPSRYYAENKRWRNLMLRISRFFTMKSRTISQQAIKECVAILKKNDVFNNLDDSELSTLALMFDTREFQDGQLICKQGDKATEVYIVYSGEICVQISGGKKIIKKVGSVVGEFGLFTEGYRTASLTAHGETVVLSLDYQRFSQFLLAFPKATLNLLKYTVLQLTHSD